MRHISSAYRRSHHDDPREWVGALLALCRLHHWTFDQGLVGIRPDRVVEVYAVVEQGENQAEVVLALRQQTLSLPSDPALAPATAALEWHAKPGVSEDMRWTGRVVVYLLSLSYHKRTSSAESAATPKVSKSPRTGSLSTEHPLSPTRFSAWP